MKIADFLQLLSEMVERKQLTFRLGKSLGLVMPDQVGERKLIPNITRPDGRVAVRTRPILFVRPEKRWLDPLEAVQLVREPDTPEIILGWWNADKWYGFSQDAAARVMRASHDFVPDAFDPEGHHPKLRLELLNACFRRQD